MNKYEEKFKEKLNYIKQSEMENSIRLEEISNKLDSIENIIDSLEAAIESLSDPTVIDAIEKQIRFSRTSYEEWVAAQDAVIESLESSAKYKKILQELCPHENYEVAGYDGYKCDLCDKEY